MQDRGSLRRGDHVEEGEVIPCFAERVLTWISLNDQRTFKPNQERIEAYEEDDRTTSD